ncbi:MAG: hypothetical protein L0Y58_06760 [Verrucomicrobia subdivision 3 bacterium]|nr:hypothetical protein [Limisphaerales bacterium]
MNDFYCLKLRWTVTSLNAPAPLRVHAVKLLEHRIINLIVKSPRRGDQIGSVTVCGQLYAISEPVPHVRHEWNGGTDRAVSDILGKSNEISPFMKTTPKMVKFLRGMIQPFLRSQGPEIALGYSSGFPISTIQFNDSTLQHSAAPRKTGQNCTISQKLDDSRKTGRRFSRVNFFNHLTMPTIQRFLFYQPCKPWS